MAVPVFSLVLSGTALFYKIEKNITRRRAHGPIHPCGYDHRCSSLFCGETNRPCIVDMLRIGK
nr:MAG TPA: hypothetical protein [Caudoviricetes sp.]